MLLFYYIYKILLTNIILSEGRLETSYVHLSIMSCEISMFETTDIKLHLYLRSTIFVYIY